MHHHPVFAVLLSCGVQVSHQWTVSMVQLHAHAVVVCDESATAEMRVKTVKYYTGLEKIHNSVRCCVSMLYSECSALRLHGGYCVMVGLPTSSDLSVR